uniref:Amino acid transporter n=1 Tax=Steinernema glaseri TaxID=37863 RepID=A0A1I8A4V7_9BILA
MPLIYILRESESMHLIHRSRSQSMLTDCGSPEDVASASAARKRMTVEQPTELTPVVGEERKAKMGILSATSYVIGNIIGSGIFITPTSIVQHAGSVYLSLLVWAVSAFISLMGGISFVELGTAISDPGCDFAYVCYVKWFAIAFSFMWVSVLFTYPACAAVQALTFGQYLVQGVAPILEIPPEYVVITEKSLAFVVLILITWMNWYALDKYAAKFQVVVTFAKLVSMGVIICAGLYLIIFKDKRENFSNGWEGSNWSPGGLVMAFYGGLWSYAGWDILNYGTPEIKNPKRTLPLALIVGILSVAAVFVLINVSYFSVISVEEMKNSNAVAALFSQKALGNFSYAIPFMIAVLLMGSLNSNIFCSSRFMHAAARQGQLPPALSCVNSESQCPRAAILAQTAITIVFLLFDVESLINYTTFVLWFQKAVTMVALIYMRYNKTPVNKDVVRIPIVISIIFLIFCTLLTVVPLYEEPVTTVSGFVFVFSGVLFYAAFVKYSKSESLNSFKETFNKKSIDLTCRILSSHVDLKTDYKEASQSDASEDLSLE